MIFMITDFETIDLTLDRSRYILAKLETNSRWLYGNKNLAFLHN